MISFLKAEEQHQHENGGGWVANTATVEAIAVTANATDIAVSHPCCARSKRFFWRSNSLVWSVFSTLDVCVIAVALISCVGIAITRLFLP
jgi:hypothetical protein